MEFLDLDARSQLFLHWALNIYIIPRHLKASGGKHDLKNTLFQPSLSHTGRDTSSERGFPLSSSHARGNASSKKIYPL